MIARFRLLLAILVLALAPALAPAPVAAAMPAACDACDHSCDDPCDQGVLFDCLSHAAAPVLLMSPAALAQPAAEAERTALPRHSVLATTTWPPPVRPPRS